MSDKYRIDSHKLMFHPDRVSKWLDKYNLWGSAKEIYPIYAEISPIGICNHRCSFCGLDFMGYQNVKIDTAVLKQRLSEMASLGLKSVMFAGEGEPSLHKDMPEIMDFCTELGIDTALTTNIVPFNAKNSEVFVKNAKWIKVSINAGNRDAYSKIHNTKPEDFDKAVENMKYCIEIKKSKGYSCTIGAQMLLLNDNFDTAVDLASISKYIGLDYLVIKPYSQHLSSNTIRYKNINYSKYLHLEAELEKYNSADFKVIFRANTINKTLNDDKKYQKCFSTPFFWAYIASNGDVYGCSCFLGDERFCYGNINEETFKNIWEGERRKQNYEELQGDFDINNCRLNCRMDEINRYLWELAHPTSHVNFI